MRLRRSLNASVDLILAVAIRALAERSLVVVSAIVSDLRNHPSTSSSPAFSCAGFADRKMRERKMWMELKEVTCFNHTSGALLSQASLP
jgi:hypothetical protein